MVKKRNGFFIGMLIVFGLLLYFFRGFGHGQLPTPGEELTANCFTDTDCQSANQVCANNHCKLQYPTQGACNGQNVTLYGKPTYYTDPVMQHMKGQGCATTNQCRQWPPEGTKQGDTECCLNTGLCYGITNPLDAIYPSYKK